MKKVPITDVINSWLKADARLAEQCKEDICEYHSDSAYRGFMLGFDEGVNTQIISENEAKKMLLITKREIVNGFKNVDVAGCAKLVTDEDCVNLLSSSQEYWFLAGAMWLMEQVKNTNESK